METFEKNDFFIKIIKGVGISFIFTLICLTIFSAVLTYTNLSEKLIQPVVITVTGISILIGSIFTTKKMTKNGMIKGVEIGLIYIILIYLISSIINDGNFALNFGSVILILAGTICGAIGGIIGANIG